MIQNLIKDWGYNISGYINGLKQTNKQESKQTNKKQQIILGSNISEIMM